MSKNEKETGRQWIGLDVGGTKIEGVAVNYFGDVLGRVLLLTDANSAEQAVESIAHALEMTLKAAGDNPSQVAGVGLGIPGKVEDGVVSLAVNLKLERYPLAEVLEKRFHVPVYLENDVRAAALGAYDWVCKQYQVSSMVYLSLGTGISAGLILDGKLYRGSGGMAGEIGHAVLDPGGTRCKCGMYGCFETVAAGPAIARIAETAAQDAAKRGYYTPLLDASPLTAEAVFQWGREGDDVAKKVIQRAAHFVALAIFNLIMHYDVEIVALGGGVSQAGEIFLTPVYEELARLAIDFPLANEMLWGGSQDGSHLVCKKVILVPREAVPAWKGMILMAKAMANGMGGAKEG